MYPTNGWLEAGAEARIRRLSAEFATAAQVERRKKLNASLLEAISAGNIDVVVKELLRENYSGNVIINVLKENGIENPDQYLSAA